MAMQYIEDEKHDLKSRKVTPVGQSSDKFIAGLNTSAAQGTAYAYNLTSIAAVSRHRQYAAS
jgi:hypothetical protein